MTSFEVQENKSQNQKLHFKEKVISPVLLTLLADSFKCSERYSQRFRYIVKTVTRFYYLTAQNSKKLKAQIFDEYKLDKTVMHQPSSCGDKETRGINIS